MEKSGLGIDMHVWTMLKFLTEGNFQAATQCGDALAPGQANHWDPENTNARQVLSEHMDGTPVEWCEEVDISWCLLFNKTPIRALCMKHCGCEDYWNVFATPDHGCSVACSS